ncbi:uncharacterized protein JN550_003285 [Neoarthrinium moseri]|uniref:uncharacterized protein n=1 Tax=Neoarthrinium moseri TaxID=1658444 RepID=UPI001FDC0003|nr:uncharacterized protein JN550_003285 [Neoarthrinium moseri]KAI1873032.1 hypothetical protein JN550_003285 [Neoarthrinium moseri]
MAEQIAIVGSACRFPGGASSPSKLWDLLKSPRDVVRDFPPERLNFQNFHSHNGEHHGRTDVQGRSYLLQEDCRLFDAAFFKINPMEAEGMDPQQRLLLETVFEAIEAAGWPMEELEGSQTSVHVGNMTVDFNDIQMRDPEALPTYSATGLARSILSNRISFFFDFKGPSVTIDTACSSSLVALHQAVQCLRNGEASQAVVAGVTLLLDPGMYIAESKLHMLSPDSRSRMWDKDANGYARGEGCAVVVLKPLAKAIADNDHIECIIRETGVNSDGRTDGITMPSSTAQASLILQTYRRAGLNPIKDRPQFFECHGTGTLAGDPVEARAIKEAFFHNTDGSDEIEVIDTSQEPLYCGSVKTVIGHLEGCAGLAGVLKASLALQNKIIPPNMHFSQLNPAIEPFYENVHVPTSSQPWPETQGRPLRASVNSFGFGGTNAHAILERFSYADHQSMKDGPASEMGPIGPFVFSAKSRTTLLRQLKQTVEHIQSNPLLDLDALAWVLQTRRTALSMRTCIHATDRQGLLDGLEKQIHAAEVSSDAPFGVKANTLNDTKQFRILGVFTGQGAQTAAMGRELMASSPIFLDAIRRCEEALKLIPEPAEWSLIEELGTEGPRSRVAQAQFSQPLCTAIQIGLVDLLRASGISFGAVVGHSSGEIGAAYAAGILDVKDAMGIAYYRGLVSSLARGSKGEEGGMMAVGLSLNEARAFCSRPEFSGRLQVAASNGPSTVTLSGDLNAIRQAEEISSKEGTFARRLQVDTAYHSHHMRPCATAYLGYLRALDVQVRQSHDSCFWSSSVHRNVDMRQRLGELRDQYWVDNMVKTVLFTQSTLFAIQSVPSLTVGLELGPHPALKGPVTQTWDSIRDSPLPYAGCLDRKVGNLFTISTAIGLVWSHLGPSAVDFEEFRDALGSSRTRRVLKDLPAYPWDHDQIYWHESRLSHNYRRGSRAPNMLLGRLQEDCKTEMTWRNIFRLNEMPWLRGHTFQGQVIFPGAGYVSMALEAAKSFARERHVEVVEIHNVSITKALVIEEDTSGVEVLFTLRQLDSTAQKGHDQRVLKAAFSCYSCSDGHVLDAACHGQLTIHLGEPGKDTLGLPQRQISSIELPPLHVERFFKAIDSLGIVYKGSFRALESINRIRGHAQAAASWADGQLNDSMLLHPEILDVGFQVGFATFASIAEGAMGATYLPKGIRRVVVDYAQSLGEPSGTATTMEAHLINSSSDIVEVDINICDTRNGISRVQVEGLLLKAIAEPQPTGDRLLYAKTVWDNDAAGELIIPSSTVVLASDLEYIDAVERTALFFMKSLTQEFCPQEIRAFKWYHQELFRAIELFLKPVREGIHPVLKQEWLQDNRATIRTFSEQYPGSVDLQLLTAVGENWPSVMRGESEMLEHMLKDTMLSRLYMDGRGFSICNDYVAAYMKKITHKYPRTRILEIGAGTGGTTRSVLDSIGDAYTSYAYTDISAGFFEHAAERFTDHSQKMEFKTFNAEKTPGEQGLAVETYDIIIAANVLHATRNLAQTMQNVRSLLRPGGFLVAVEVTGTMLREPGLMGGLEGWWLGVDDGRFPCPGISAKSWHDVFQSNGFSGVDSIAYDFPEVKRHNCSVLITQAVDEKYDVLRNPITSIDAVPETQFLIVGGATLPVSKAVRRVEKMLRRWTPRIKAFNSVADLDPSEVSPGTSVLCLSDLDEPIFKALMDSKRLNNLQEMLGNAENVLWVTSGRLSHDPYSNMMIGIGRALAFELPHVRMQFLDFDEQSSWDMEMVVQYLARMVLLSSPQYLDYNMLWTHEPEVHVRGDQTLVPRLIRDDSSNESLNSRRRQVTRLAKESESVELIHGDDQTVLVKTKQSHQSDTGSVEFVVRLSVALHSKDEAPCYLCFGKVGNSDKPAFALSKTDCSTHVLPPRQVFEPRTLSTCDDKLLISVASSLIACHILSSYHGEETLMVYEPTEGIAEAISNAAERKVLFVSGEATQTGKGCITIHPLSSARTVRRLIPADARFLLDLSGNNQNAPASMMGNIPLQCSCVKFRPNTIPNDRTTLGVAFDMAVLAKTGPSPKVVKIGETEAEEFCTRRLATVIDWERTGPLSIVIPPPDAQQVFSGSKTYLLVGMAGELGQSLCRYMSSCGARHIVVASRNPACGERWLEDMRAAGVNIHATQLDVTDRDQVQATLSKLRTSMPQIGGVANAALVLEDSLFVNATADSVNKQLKPKVDGTVHLNDDFVEDDLDFFIVFSSLGSVYGNAGQSIYHAANMFMTSLVEQRRSKGKSASVIDVGMISDIGYVAKSERSGSGIEKHLQSQFYMPLAETEFHHLFLQGVLCGHPSSENAHLTIGIQPFIDEQDAIKPQWYDNPYFSHMVVQPSSSNGSNQPATSAQQLQERLESVSSIEQASDVYHTMFRNKMEAMMKIPATSIDIYAPLSDLGLDSLLGVEIRTWLLKEMYIDVPLLRILGRDSIASICSVAAERLLSGKVASNADDKAAETVFVSVGSADNVQALQVPEQTVSYSTSQVSEASLSSEFGTPADSKTTDTGSYDQDLPPVLRPTIVSTSWEPTSLFPIEFSRTERMSYAQASLHFLQTYLDDPTTFNVTAQYEINGSLNVSRFTQALEKTLARHDAFQTCFFTEPGTLEPKQGVAAVHSGDRVFHVESASIQTVCELYQSLALQQWDLTSGRTFQAILVTHASDVHSLIIECHHLIMDGMSWHLFLRDLDRAYQMLPFQPNIVPSYLDFARNQEQALAEGGMDTSLAYWMSKLQPIPAVIPLLPLAQTRTRKTRRKYGNNRLERELSLDMVGHVKKASQACRSTPMQFYLSVLQVLLSRLLDLQEVCIGVTDLGRGYSASDNGREETIGQYGETVGHFTNLLPMRFNIDRHETFSHLVHETSRTVLEGQSHATVPLDIILSKLDMERSPSHTPVFQVAFNYRVGSLLQRKLGGCTMNLIQYEDAKNPYDITLNVTQTAKGGHSLELLTSDYLYSAPTSEFLMNVYIHLLKSLSSDQRWKLRDCKLYDDEKVGDVLRLGHGPRIVHEWPDTISRRIQKVYSAFPQVIAIKDSTTSVTYAQLARRVQSIGQALMGAGVEPYSCVAVLCEPSIDTFASMLAILHIGAVYVPLDMSLPATRHRTMVAACDAKLLVFHHRTSDAASQFDSISKVDLSQELGGSKQRFPAEPFESDTSFVLFTSGSTGTPKGIRLSQSGIMNYAASKSAELGLKQPKVLQQSSTGFDMSVAQAVNALANAGTLVVAPLGMRGDPVAIGQMMLAEQIEFTLCTPSEYLMLFTYGGDSLRHCTSWTHACCGGEAVTEKLVSEFRRLELPNLNMLTDCYGPTEISCAATFCQIPLSTHDKVELHNSIGKAISNTSIYILGQDSGMVPVGFEGEICVGGAGVARGYQDAATSSARFIANPFATAEDVSRGWTTLYRTGDKGCIREDGSIVFLGRMDGDTLIKLRGLRIELTEVANIIMNAGKGSFADTIVTVRGPSDSQFLVAHVAVAEENRQSQEDLDRICAELPLPRYMVPSIIVALDRLPTSSNGKVDRKAVQSLPLPDRNKMAHMTKAEEPEPLTVAEGELRLIWREVLGEAAGAANIRAGSDFFTVGGSSLLLVRLQNALKEKIGVQLPLKDLYQASTLRNMAVVTSHERGDLIVDMIDWEAETGIQDEVLSSAGALITHAPKRTQRQVLLTGATGFLGFEILAKLLEDDDVSHVHCIAVNPDHASKLPKSDKITVYTGSLLSPTLGLSSRDMERLQQDVDQIIHAGAQGHCLNNYSSVRAANYVSTQFLLLKLAVPRAVPFDYISSARVILYESGSHASAPVSMAAHPPPTDGSQGYTASKWASERWLERVASIEAMKLPITIHRHCSIIGATAPHDDAMNSVIRYSILSSTVPALPNAEGYFDFEDVSKVAQSIAAKTDRDPAGGLEFRHHSSNIRVPFSDLAQRMTTLYGGEFTTVGMDEWLRSAEELGIEDLIVSYLKANVVGSGQLSFPYLGA